MGAGFLAGWPSDLQVHTSGSGRVMRERDYCPRQAHSTSDVRMAGRAISRLAGLPRPLWPLTSTTIRCAYTSEEMTSLVGKQLVVDTLALARKFEGAGLDRKPAEMLAEHITELVVANKVRMEEICVDKQLMSKTNMEQEMRTTAFKNELQNTQGMQSTNMLKELERQQTFLDKMRAETRHEIDKLVASQRLDMNLEKGRMRDDLQVMRDKVTELEIKLDHDINEVRSSVEKSKNDTIKSVITILGTFSAIMFTISRLTHLGG